MRAAVIASDKVTVETVPDPQPAAREVVLAVAGCGICGTDLHIADGQFAPTLPVVPGHEFAGEVVAVGADVAEVRVGDQVAVDPSLYCHECYFCRRGRGNQCERWGGIGVTVSGAAARVRAGPGGQLRPAARGGVPGRRGADRAAVLRGARLRRAGPGARRPLPHLRGRHHGPDDDGAGQAVRRGHA